MIPDRDSISAAVHIIEALVALDIDTDDVGEQWPELKAVYLRAKQWTEDHPDAK